jgi:murein DD-endopeptidase MepM/ murein hydrolase activator NlpD
MKTLRNIFFLIFILLLGLASSAPKAAAWQVSPPPERTLFTASPAADALSATGTLKLRLPYDYSRVIEWVGGPHQWDNNDGFAPIAFGQGSGMDFAAPVGDLVPNFDVANMVAGTVLQVNSKTTPQGLCSDSSDKPGYGCWVAVQEPTYNTIIIYAHLRPNTISVLAKDNVFQGQYLGQAGQSGGQSRIGLHVELRDGTTFSCASLDSCNWGSPLGWEKYALFLDNYTINGFFTTGSSIQNNDGSAVYDPTHTFATDVIANFPYLDWGGSSFTQNKRVQVTARTSPGFVCDLNDWTCETNVDNTTQFAGKRKAPGVAFSATIPDPGAGYLISTNILVKPTTDPITGIGFCGLTNFGYPCVNYTWTSDDACIDLAGEQMANRVNSLRFRGDYSQNFEVVLFSDAGCLSSIGNYTTDATTLGVLNDTAGSAKIKKHSPVTSTGKIELYNAVGFTGTAQSFTWTNNNLCIDLTPSGMSDHSKSLQFFSGYIGNYDVIAYSDNLCQTFSATYTEDVADFGVLADTFSSIKMQQHSNLVPDGRVDLYVDSSFAGTIWSSIQYISDAYCHNLTPLGVNGKLNSFRFRSGYISEFDAVFYTDTDCKVFGGQYGQDVGDFGVALRDQFSSVRLLHHGPAMPDLMPFPADGFDAPVVISMEQGATSSSKLVAGRNAWVGWGGNNVGPVAAPAGHFIDLMLDGQIKIHYQFPAMPSDTWEGFKAWGLGSDITPGWHRIDMVMDSTHVLSETNITNNRWTGMFFWETPSIIFMPFMSR